MSNYIYRREGKIIWILVLLSPSSLLSKVIITTWITFSLRWNCCLYFLGIICSLSEFAAEWQTTPTYLYPGLNNVVQGLNYFCRKRQEQKLCKLMAGLIVLNLLNCFAVAKGRIKGKSQCTSSQTWHCTNRSVYWLTCTKNFTSAFDTSLLCSLHNIKTWREIVKIHLLYLMRTVLNYRGGITLSL
jgi:hypothetical protein